MKAKPKGQAHNLKLYWLGFGLLMILLLFPIRLGGYWNDGSFIDYLSINRAIYVGLAISSLLILLRFAYRYPVKSNLLLVAFMMITVTLSAHHSMPQNIEMNRNCNKHEWSSGLDVNNVVFLGEAWCSRDVYGGGCWREHLRIEDSPLMIDIYWTVYKLFPNQILVSCG
ncbi:MAG: hypothetical protein AAFV93_00955 [Chloroflexota bacterium]